MLCVGAFFVRGVLTERGNEYVILSQTSFY